MRSFLLAAAAVAWIAAASGALAADPFGPPESLGEGNDVWMGVGYFRYETKWKPGGGNFGDVAVRENRVYVEAMDPTLSVSGKGEGFLRIGGADFDDGEGFKDSMSPFVSIGTKDVWYGDSKSRFQVGTIAQFSIARGYQSQQTLVAGSPVHAKIKLPWDIGVAAAIQKHLGERLLVYGGTQLVYGRASVHRQVGSGVSDSTMYTEKSNFGIFGGARFYLPARLVLDAEVQFRGGTSAGVSAAYSF